MDRHAAFWTGTAIESLVVNCSRFHTRYSSTCCILLQTAQQTVDHFNATGIESEFACGGLHGFARRVDAGRVCVCKKAGLPWCAGGRCSYGCRCFTLVRTSKTRLHLCASLLLKRLRKRHWPERGIVPSADSVGWPGLRPLGAIKSKYLMKPS